MSSYIADTHAFVWYLTSDKRLGTTARNIIARAEHGRSTVYLPTIVLAETEGTLVKLHRQKKISKIPQFIPLLDSFPSFRIYPFDDLILNTYTTVDNTLEIHDRIIAATAIVTNSVVITKDTQLIQSKIIKTVW